jgi:STE24 endopeptidase
LGLDLTRRIELDTVAEAVPPRDAAGRAWDDPTRARAARSLGNAARAWWAIDLALATIALAVVVATGMHVALRDAIPSGASWAPPRVAFAVQAGIYVGALAFGGVLLGTPAAWFGGHRLLKSHGLGTQSARGWLRDYAIASAIGTGLSGAFGFVVGGLCFSHPGSWWAWATAVGAIGTLFVTYLAPVVILPLFYRGRPLPEGEVRDALVNLAARAGTGIRTCVVIDQSRRSRAANAAVVGIGQTRRIVVTDTLLGGGYATSEIGAILAHELGHHVRRDVPWAIATEVAIFGVCLFAAESARDASAVAVGLIGPADLAGLPVLALTSGACFLAAMPLRKGLSRWREARADAYGVALTGDRAAWASTLRRLAVQNLAEVDPHPFVEWATYSHPSIRRRLIAVETEAGRG